MADDETLMKSSEGEWGSTNGLNQIINKKKKMTINKKREKCAWRKVNKWRT
jgi:hypothetical protein